MCPSNSATPSPVNQPTVVNQPTTHVPVGTTSEILTVEDLAKWLKVSKRSIYEMTASRGQQRHENPVPILRLPVGLRFRRSDIEQWLNRCADAGRVN
jgi:predicted DNA-binding transcriptional regulator AlpA